VLAVQGPALQVLRPLWPPGGGLAGTGARPGAAGRVMQRCFPLCHWKRAYPLGVNGGILNQGKSVLLAKSVADCVVAVRGGADSGDQGACPSQRYLRRR